MRRLLAWLVVGVVGAGGLLLIADFALGFQDSIQVGNASGSNLSRVAVSMGGVEVWTGSLKNGEIHSIRRSTPAEGAIKAHVETPDGAMEAEEFGYVTRGTDSRYFVTVRNPLEIAVVQCMGGLFGGCRA